MAIDPVCGTEVDPATASQKTEYRGDVNLLPRTVSPGCRGRSWQAQSLQQQGIDRDEDA